MGERGKRGKQSQMPLVVGSLIQLKMSWKGFLYFLGIEVLKATIFLNSLTPYRLRSKHKSRDTGQAALQGRAGKLSGSQSGHPESSSLLLLILLSSWTW